MSGRNQPENRILVGRIGAAHGISGEVRLTSFTENPLAIGDYGPLSTDRPGLSIAIETVRASKTVLIARLGGVSDRTGAETLNGVSLYIERDRLAPPGEDEFYHADLIGLEVRLADGTVLGEIVAVTNFGADDLLDVRLAGTRRSVYLPFTKRVIPTLAIAEGHVVAVPPDGWLEQTPRDPEDRDE